MDARITVSWKEAEWDYQELQAGMQLSLLGTRPTHQALIAALRRIARKCPSFYPGKIELGLRLLSQ